MVPRTLYAADTVGASHNSINSVGRNRANVIYNHAKATVQPQKQQPIMQPDAVNVDIAEVIETVAPSPVVPIAPQTEITPDLTPDIAKATQYIEQLKSEIKQIDSEIERCKKAKTNWTIGTVVGGVGVVGTATGAIVQAVQIDKAKKNGAMESTSDADNSTKESK